MNIKLKLEKLCKNLSLSYKEKLYNNIVCEREIIIIDNYLSGCPDSRYSKYKNNNSKNKLKNIKRFFNSKEFKLEKSDKKGSKTNKKDIKWKINIINKSKIDDKTKKKLILFYKQIEKHDKGYGISIVDKETSKEKEIILHEFIHILLESNNLRPKSWKWNEGLVTYLTSYALNKENQHKENPNKTRFKSNFFYNYCLYAHKWHLLLNHIKYSKERLKIIKEKVKKV